MILTIPDPAPDFTTRRSDRGWAVHDREGQRVTCYYDRFLAADVVRARKQRLADQSKRKTVRPCLCCRKPFQSEGIHNRLCDLCRTSARQVMWGGA